MPEEAFGDDHRAVIAKLKVGKVGPMVLCAHQLLDGTIVYIYDDLVSVQLSDLTLLNVLGCILFLYSRYQQYKAGILLANLRKNEKGQVVRYDHVIPRGDWFELVSSPHMLAEIMVYMALTCVLWGSTIWPAIFVWVFCNQVECALLTHWWYQSKFKSYPKERKAIIPHVL
ncbi:polyprenol reductase-like [Anabrus simplex]|uniref:polyprenol reductase-like n=1 Tax=Anabrus simplex TaxID=316456 RepID=UPI0035A29774